MEKFVRRDAIEGVKIAPHRFRTDFDGGGISVLHAAAARASRKVIEERVGFKGAVLHPTDGRGNDAMQVGDDFLRVVVAGIGVDDYAKVTAGFVEIGFLKSPNLDGRI